MEKIYLKLNYNKYKQMNELSREELQQKLRNKIKSKRNNKRQSKKQQEETKEESKQEINEQTINEAMKNISMDDLMKTFNELKDKPEFEQLLKKLNK